MFEKQRTRFVRLRKCWVAWCMVLLAAIGIAGAAVTKPQPICTNVVTNLAATAEQTGQGACKGYASCTITCQPEQIGNDCTVCCHMSFFLWNPILKIWHEVTDVECESDGYACGENGDVGFTDTSDGLPVGEYMFKARFHYGTCGVLGEGIGTRDSEFYMH